MPTLPSAALFDKDLSLRSPFPRHVSAPTQAIQQRSGHPGTRSDFSQIKRPTPLKARPSSSLSTPQQSQSIPHSLRNLIQFPKAPSTIKGIKADGQLNRIYNASPMPKIIDQAYSSLTVKSRAQPQTSFVFSSPSPKTREADIRVNSPAANNIENEDSVYVPDIVARGKVAPEPETHADSPTQISSPPLHQDDSPFFEFDQPQEQTVLEECPGPKYTEDARKEDEIYQGNLALISRKRKSTASLPQDRSKLRKTSPVAKTGIKPTIQETVDIDPPAMFSRRRRRKLEPEFPSEFEENTENSSSIEEVHDKDTRTEPKSKFSRIRTSVGQWFKGSFWDPPDSSRRKRRPPSQWWMPSETTPKPKRNRRPKTEISQEAEMASASALSPKENKAADANAVATKEGESVTRIISKEIYDFSDG